MMFNIHFHFLQEKEEEKAKVEAILNQQSEVENQLKVIEKQLELVRVIFLINYIRPPAVMSRDIISTVEGIHQYYVEDIQYCVENIKYNGGKPPL